MDRAPVRVRALEDGELDAWIDGERKSFGYDPGAAWRGVLEACELHVADVADELVGGAAQMRSGLSVPGGRLPISLVTSVWVAPARRGLGVFRELVEAVLAATTDVGLSATALIAAEPDLYRRFGFGVASLGSSLRIRRDSAAFAEAVESPGSLRLLDRDEGVGAAAPVYDRLALRIPGMLDREECWWEYSYPRDDPDESDDVFVVHDADDGPDGYAAYSVREQPPEPTLLLHELVAETSTAYRALWSHVLDHSRCRWIEAENRPVDEPLLHMLSEPGSVRTSIFDLLHVRLLEIPRTLSARRYSTSDELVLDVHDDAGGWAAGRWLHAGSGEGADCRPTDRPAEIALDVSALACAYLGATSFEALRREGRIDELAPGAVQRADELFSWSPAPWLPWDY
jgi:predicted acetyltransferase